MQLQDQAFDASGTLNPWYYEMPEIGYNYRLSDIHAALGLSQLGKLDGFAARRRALAAVYDELLAPLAPTIVPVRNRPGTDPVQHLYQVLIDFPAFDTTRATVMDALQADGIGTQVHYIPVHSQPYYRARYGDLNFPGAEAFYRRCLSLPFYPALTGDDAERVVEALKRATGKGEEQC
jgi:dTDP-4-amino-4,6-dideoxygalactose transaminase